MQQHPFYCFQTKDGCQKNIAKCRFQFPTLIQVIIRSTNPLIITLLLPTVFYASSASRFIITLRNISSCKLHRTNRDPDFLKGSFNKKGIIPPTSKTTLHFEKYAISLASASIHPLLSISKTPAPIHISHSIYKFCHTLSSAKENYSSM